MTSLVLLAVLAADARFVVASTANVRRSPDAKAEVVARLSIGVELTVLETQGDWAHVKQGAHEGWVLAELLDAEKPTLEAFNARFDATPKSDSKARRKWAERAAALAPSDVPTLQRLVQVLDETQDLVALEHARTGLARARAKVGQISVAATHVSLLYEKGDASECLYEDPKVGASLWNTIIGEGSAGGSSKSISLIVEVFGPAGSKPPAGRAVEIQVREASGRSLLKKKVKLVPFDRQGESAFDYVVSGTGCEPLVITAGIAGQPERFELESRVGFSCGE